MKRNRVRRSREHDAAMESKCEAMKVDIVKVEGASGHSIYLPWDMDLCEIAGQERIEELAAMDIDFWEAPGPVIELLEGDGAESMDTS